VKDKVRSEFGPFYAALLDRTLARHPGAVVTEYSWDAASCDPCPGPTLDGSDLATLGSDALADAASANPSQPSGGNGPAAPPVWRGGTWGGPPAGVQSKGTQAGQNTAFTARGAIQLAAMVQKDNPETKIDSGPLVPAPAVFAGGKDTPAPASSATPETPETPSATPDAGPAGPPAEPPPAGGCAGCRVGPDPENAAPLGLLASLALAIGRLLRRARSRSEDRG
jgi:hypothetical protein